MLGVVQFFLQRSFCIRRLQKHYVAGNAVTSNKIRQGHFLQEGQIFNTLVEISVLKFSPCRKQRCCLNFLPSTAFTARLHACRFPMHDSFCTQKCETQFSYSNFFLFRCFVYISSFCLAITWWQCGKQRGKAFAEDSAPQFYIYIYRR